VQFLISHTITALRDAAGAIDRVEATGRRSVPAPARRASVLAMGR